jgi:hypothetical protein
MILLYIRACPRQTLLLQRICLRPSDSLRLVQIEIQALHDELPKRRVERKVRRARAAHPHGRRVRRAEHRHACQLLRDVERARRRDRQLARRRPELQHLRELSTITSLL